LFFLLFARWLSSLGSTPNSIRIFVYSPENGFWDIGDPAQVIQMAYNSSQQELEELRVVSLKVCQAVEEGEAQAGAPRRVASAPCAGMSPDVCIVHSTWGSKRPLVW
jgi:hypothetical protein